METIEDLLKRIEEFKREFLLSEDGEIIDCFCGCGFKIFVSPILDLPIGQKVCSVCFKEIKKDEDEVKVMYKFKLISHYHKSCDPEKIRDLFPIPS